MMSRGISSPVWVRRNPVSISCAASVLISMISPRFACAGTLTIARAIRSNLPRGRPRASPRPPRCRTRTSRRSSGRWRSRSACRRAARASTSTRARRAGRDATLTTSGSGFFSVRTWIALTWSAAVIGLSTDDRERHRVAVVDQRRQRRASPCRGATGASPTTLRMASSNAALRNAAMLGVDLGLAPRSTARRRRRRASRNSSARRHLSVDEIGHDVFNLFRGQHRLAAKRGRDARQAFGPVVRRHDGVAG